MPNYGMPGVAIGHRGSRWTGLAALVVAAGVILAWNGFGSIRGDDRFTITLHTEKIGAGIIEGSDVRVDGVKIGAVDGIEPADNGTALIHLALDRTQSFGLTDQLRIGYAPGNLFGISEIELHRGIGGTTLPGGAVLDLTGPRANAVADTTMGRLLSTLTTTVTDVLTPEFTDVLTSTNTSLEAFTPIIEAMVTLSRTVADTQRYLPSYLIAQYADALSGAPGFTGGLISILYEAANYAVIRDDKPAFDHTIDVVSDGVLTGVAALLVQAERFFPAYADMSVPILQALARAVPTPQQSGAELGTLLARLGSAFTDSPGGPVLQLAVTLHGVPVLAELLLGSVPGVGR
ncbi:MlaD family protein [Nocardia sp. NPDC051030]|uniref:MlaD family protein n=1 Tax=Nocardia sp. NPDC051030 TaxID=3155162 RepID=UPI00342BD2DB